MPTVAQIQQDLGINAEQYETLYTMISTILSNQPLDRLQGKEADEFYDKVVYPDLKRGLPVLQTSLDDKDGVGPKHIRYLFTQVKRKLKNRQAKKESDQSPTKRLQNISIHGENTENPETPSSTTLAAIRRDSAVVSQSHQQRTDTETLPTSITNTIDVEKLSLFSVDTYFVKMETVRRKVSTSLLRSLVKHPNKEFWDPEVTRPEAIEKLSFQKWLQFVKEDLDAAHLSIREPWDIQVQLPGNVVPETVFQSDRGFRVAVAKYLSTGPSSSTIIFEIREVEQVTIVGFPSKNADDDSESTNEGHSDPDHQVDSLSGDKDDTMSSDNGNKMSTDNAERISSDDGNNESDPANNSEKKKAHETDNSDDDDGENAELDDSDDEFAEPLEDESDDDQDSEAEDDPWKNIGKEVYRLCEHNTLKDFYDTCTFFKLDPAQARKSKFGFLLKSFKRGIALHQLMCIYWQTITNQTYQSYGGFVGDGVGLGKTTEMISLLCLNREINVAIAEVTEARQNADYSVHLPEDSTSGVCKADWSFVCPCMPDSPTREFQPILGPNLVLTQPILIQAFVSEWEKCLKDPEDKRFKMQIYVCHSQIQWSDEHFDMLLGDFQPGQIHTAPGRASVFDEEPRLDYRKEVPRQGQDTIVVVTSSRTYLQRFMRPKDRRIGAVLNWFNPRQRPKQYKEAEFIPFIPWGHVLIDECHKEKKKDTAVIRVCYFSYNAMRWMYSGTLLETDLKSDLSSYLAALSYSHECWRKDSRLTWLYEMNGRLNEVMSLHSKAVHGSASNAEKQKLLTILKDSLPALMIQRTQDSFLVKHSKLVQYGELVKEDVVCHATPRKYEIELRKLKQGILNVEGIRNMSWRRFFHYAPNLRASTTWPHLAWLINHQDTTKVTGAAGDIAKYHWYTTNSNLNPYWAARHDLYQSSSKMQSLVNNIEHVFDKDAEGILSEKLVIMSQLPTSLYIAYLCLLEKFPCLKDRIYLMRNSDTFAVRREAQQIFQNEVPEKEITIFMTTTNMAGFGLDLYKAKRCILLEPCWLSSTEVQCFARIFRIGQNAPYSYAYRYVCAEEWIEKHILMRQDKRKAVRDEVFSEAIDELAAAVAEDDMEEGAKRLREADHTAVLSTKRQRTDVDNGDVV